MKLDMLTKEMFLLSNRGVWVFVYDATFGWNQKIGLSVSQ